MNKKTTLSVLLLLSIFFAKQTRAMDASLILKTIDLFAFRLEMQMKRQLKEPISKTELEKIVDIAKRHYKDLEKLPDSKENREALKEGQKKLDQIKNIAKIIPELKKMDALVALDKRLEDLERRGKAPDPYVSGYYLKDTLENARKNAEKADDKKAFELLDKMRKIGRTIAKKWLAQMEKITEKLPKLDMEEERLVYIAINDEKEFSYLKAKVDKYKIKSKRLLRNFLGSAAEKNHADELFKELEWDSSAMVDIKKFEFLSKFHLDILLLKIKRAEQIYKELENLKKTFLLILNPEKTNSFKELRRNYSRAIQFLQEEQKEALATEKQLRFYVYFPVRRKLESAVLKIADENKKFLETTQGLLKEDLAKIDEMNAYRLSQLEKEIEGFRNIIFEKLNDENFNFFIEKVFDEIDEIKKREEIQEHLEFVPEAKKEIQKRKRDLGI